jgi:A/G-specific adenine glycosylase
MPAPGRAVGPVRDALLVWYRENRRDLPWRRMRDPYAIWISEAMLQQTRVETVIPYWERFLARFPDVTALAEADQDDVLGHWAGLGYYSRARNLHRAARDVVERHGGVIPGDVEALRELPGVGRYTAGALASIAFDLPEPVVDGNVMRVLSRLRGIRDDVGRPTIREQLWEEAADLARCETPGDLNQGLMELGATICTPRAPRCPACPVVRHCDAHRAGDAEQLPLKAARGKPRRVEGVVAWVVRGGRALAVRRPERGLLGGLWDLPGGDLRARERPAAGVGRALAERVGLAPESLRRVGAVEHVFTHRALRLHVFAGEVGAGRVRRDGYDAHRWVGVGSFDALPHAAVTAKTLDLLRERGACST